MKQRNKIIGFVSAFILLIVGLVLAIIKPKDNKPDTMHRIKRKRMWSWVLMVLAVLVAVVVGFYNNIKQYYEKLMPNKN